MLVLVLAWAKWPTAMTSKERLTRVGRGGGVSSLPNLFPLSIGDEFQASSEKNTREESPRCSVDSATFNELIGKQLVREMEMRCSVEGTPRKQGHHTFDDSVKKDDTRLDTKTSASFFVNGRQEVHEKPVVQMRTDLNGLGATNEMERDPSRDEKEYDSEVSAKAATRGEINQLDGDDLAASRGAPKSSHSYPGIPKGKPQRFNELHIIKIIKAIVGFFPVLEIRAEYLHELMGFDEHFYSIRDTVQGLMNGAEVTDEEQLRAVCNTCRMLLECMIDELLRRLLGGNGMKDFEYKLRQKDGDVARQARYNGGMSLDEKLKALKTVLPGPPSRINCFYNVSQLCNGLSHHNRTMRGSLLTAFLDILTGMGAVFDTVTEEILRPAKQVRQGTRPASLSKTVRQHQAQQVAHQHAMHYAMPSQYPQVMYPPGAAPPRHLGFPTEYAMSMMYAAGGGGGRGPASMVPQQHPMARGDGSFAAGGAASSGIAPDH